MGEIGDKNAKEQCWENRRLPQLQRQSIHCAGVESLNKASVSVHTLQCVDVGVLETGARRDALHCTAACTTGSSDYGAVGSSKSYCVCEPPQERKGNVLIENHSGEFHSSRIIIATACTNTHRHPSKR